MSVSVDDDRFSLLFIKALYSAMSVPYGVFNERWEPIYLA